MQTDIANTISRHRMIQPGLRLAVACSGGPDSTAMLFILNDLASKYGYALAVCHFNHRLREDESDKDELFVREMAARLNLPIYVNSAKVKIAAKSDATNLEARARQLRYRFFRALIAEGKADRIAVGHTADDQAETVLHRILRGAGTKGLSGIYPVVDDQIIRPLIEVRRERLMQWLKERGESWREDASNLDVRFTRNRIRRELMPNLLTYNPQVVETLSGMADVARDEEAFWDDYLPKVVPGIASLRDESVFLDIVKLKGTNVAVARRILRWTIGLVFAEERRSLPGAIGIRHVNRLLRFALEGQSGSQLQFPGGLRATKNFNYLAIQRAARGTAVKLDKSLQRSDKCNEEFCYRIDVPADVEVSEAGRKYSFQIVPAPGSGAGYNKKESVLINLDVGLSLILRSWHPGDCLKPKGHRTPKKLKEFFQRKRIPLSERGRWPVVVAGNRIVWTRGLGVAEEFLPTDQCAQVILLSEIAIRNEQTVLEK